MIAAATWPRDRPEDERLLCVDPARDAFAHARVRDLPSRVRAGDLLVVNDAATVPASLPAERVRGGRSESFEVRLMGRSGGRGGGRGAQSTESTEWRAALLGAGDWHVRTEDRSPPPELLEGERFRVGRGVVRVVGVDPRSPRLVTLAFDGDEGAMWRTIYGCGRPVQYAYMRAPLALWHVQSAFAARPWAVELPSAGRPLTFGVLGRLRDRGVSVAALTHAAGLSSTGDAAIDAFLPLEERYDIPEGTVRAIEACRGRGRIVAVGTTVVRALEGCARDHGGALVPGEGVTDLRLGGSGDGDARSRARIADGLLTGIHEPGTSHFDLLTMFASPSLLTRALASAEAGDGGVERESYLQHEFGDSLLILSGD